MSFAHLLSQPDAVTAKRAQYYEIFGNRAIWVDGWKAVSAHQRDIHHIRPSSFEEDRWELYQTDEDFSELTDLADRHPERVQQLVERWWVEA